MIERVGCSLSMNPVGRSCRSALMFGRRGSAALPTRGDRQRRSAKTRGRCRGSKRETTLRGILSRREGGAGWGCLPQIGSVFVSAVPSGLGGCVLHHPRLKPQAMFAAPRPGLKSPETAKNRDVFSRGFVRWVKTVRGLQTTKVFLFVIVAFSCGSFRCGIQVYLPNSALIPAMIFSSWRPYLT